MVDTTTSAPIRSMQLSFCPMESVVPGVES